MKRLNLEKKEESKVKYTRNTAKKTLDNVIKKIKEANENEDFIYKVRKAVLFGSYINSNKEKIGDLDIAIYVDLKDKTKDEVEQNCERCRKVCSNGSYVPLIEELFYGKIEVFKYIKDRKRILQLHDGTTIDDEAKKHDDPVSYIYFDKHKIIYELGGVS